MTTEAFESWWATSKYTQVVYSDESRKQVARDVWAAQTAEIERLQSKLESYERDFLKVRVAMGLDLHSHDDLEQYAKQQAAEIERLKGNADAAIAFCPTCAQGVTTSPGMTRDEVIFHSGRAARSLECDALKAEIERLKAGCDLAVKQAETLVRLRDQDRDKANALLRQALSVLSASYAENYDEARELRIEAAIKQHLGDV